MQKLDAVVAATGGVVLVVAIVGAAVYGGTAALAPYAVTYSTTQTELAAQEGSATGQGFVATFDVSTLNLTAVQFTITVTGGAARLAAVPIAVVVEAPAGTPSPEEQTGELPVGAETTAVVTVDAPVASTPTSTTVQASSLDGARQSALAFATANGTGTWRVTVRASPTVPPNEAVTASVVATMSHFAAAVAPEASAPAR